MIEYWFSAILVAFFIWFICFIFRFIAFVQRQIDDVHKKVHLCKLETQELKERLYRKEEEIKSLNKKQRQLRREVRRTGE